MTDIHAKLQQLLEPYRYKIEMHAHSYPGSLCSELSPRDFVRVLKEQNYDGVVLTNHFVIGQSEEPIMQPDTFEEYLENYREVRRIGEEEGLVVLLGAEIEYEYDCLLYGVDEDFLREVYNCGIRTTAEFSARYRSPEILIIEAHPFRHNFPLNAEDLDGYEVFNLHDGAANAIHFAAEHAKKHNVRYTMVGTDLHHGEHAGNSALRAKVLPKTNQELIELLRSRDYLFEIGGKCLLPYDPFDPDEADGEDIPSAHAAQDTAVFAEIKPYTDQYGCKIEMHAHIGAMLSSDSASAEEVLRGLKARGYEAVVVTDLFTDFSSAAAEAYIDRFETVRALGDTVGIRVLFGVELVFGERSYLVYGASPAWLFELVRCTPASYRDCYTALGGGEVLFVQAHPFRNGNSPEDEAPIDGIEACNMQPSTNNRLAASVRYAESQAIPIVLAGTELSAANEVGASALLARICPENEKDLGVLLRSRDYLLEIGGRILFPYNNINADSNSAAV